MLPLRQSLLAICLMAFLASPAQAMNWCAIPGLIPKSQSDFEVVAPRVAGETGCTGLPRDSAHRAAWRCEDDPATTEFEGAYIVLLRVPGEQTTLLVFTLDRTDFRDFLACPGRTGQTSDVFSAGNTLKRGTIGFGYSSGALHLLSRGESAGSMIYSTPAAYSDPIESTATESFGGFTPRRFATTQIKVAGKSIVQTPAVEVIAEMQARGAQVIRHDDDAGEDGTWLLGPMTGLDGVTGIKVLSHLRHVFSVEYTFASIEAYKLYIPMLDAEYGASKPFQSSGCTVRIWESGDASIHGSACPNKPATLNLYNDIAVDQFSALQDHLKKIDSDSDGKRDAPAPSIDRDNF